MGHRLARFRPRKVPCRHGIDEAFLLSEARKAPTIALSPYRGRKQSRETNENPLGTPYKRPKKDKQPGSLPNPTLEICVLSCWPLCYFARLASAYGPSVLGWNRYKDHEPRPQGWGWWKSLRNGKVAITHPVNNALIQSEWVTFEGIHKSAQKPGAHFWLISVAPGNKYWRRKSSFPCLAHPPRGPRRLLPPPPAGKEGNKRRLHQF